MDYDKKYNVLEPILHKINQEHIQFKDNEDRINTAILNKVITTLITKMKEDKLFNQLYTTNYFGGSYYCGLKVGRPDEYDLDMLFQLPLHANPQIEVSDLDGFVNARALNMEQFLLNSILSSKYPGFKKLLFDDDDYMITDKVLKWMESVVNKALNSLKSGNENYASLMIDGRSYQLFLRKQGPAFTIVLKLPNAGLQKPLMCIDLVPCFVFTEKNWPGFPYSKNLTPNKGEFFIVPKKLLVNGEELIQYWRLSFQMQENELIKQAQFLKTSLKLIKKLRDEFDHKAISSYYIKTVFLWEYTKQDNIWNKSLSSVFMTMLKKYQNYIERGQIEYFWNKQYNLIGHVPSYHLQQISNTLKLMIRDIDNHLDDPERVLKYFTRSMRIRYECVEDINYGIDNITIDEAVSNKNNSWCTLL